MWELFENPFFVAIFAFPGSLMFAMSLKAPRRSILLAGIGGLIGQLIYVAFNTFTNIYVAVFAATLITSVFSEIGSRIVKTPATVIAYPALVPLVPGVMLYKAMFAFSQNQITDGATELISAIIYTGCMAVAITASSVAAKRLITPAFTLLHNKKETT